MFSCTYTIKILESGKTNWEVMAITQVRDDDALGQGGAVIGF